MAKRTRLKIPGITGMPLVFTRLRGRMDGKRGTVTQDETGWHGHYLEGKKACYAAFIHSLYTGLEANSAPLYEEGARLMVEYRDVLDKLTLPNSAPAGSTASLQARSAGRIAAARSELERRRLEIELRLAVIDETLAHGLNDASGRQRQAVSLTGKRLEAYLHGAALTAGKVRSSAQVEIPPVSAEEEFRSRHSFDDQLRHDLLDHIQRGVVRE